MELFFNKPPWLQLDISEEKNIFFKNMPRDFIQVFRSKITNLEVESTVREKKYFMNEGFLHAKATLGEHLWR